MMETIKRSGYAGPSASSGHVDDADVEEILRGNLRGLGFTPR